MPRALHHAHELKGDDSATTDLLYLSALDLAETNRTAGKYSHSLGYLEEAAELRPNEPEPHLLMAQIYNASGQPKQATAEQQEADRLSKSRGQAQ